MRKSWIVLCLLAFVIAFAACDGDTTTDTSDEKTTESSTEAVDDGAEDPDAFCAAAQDFARSIGTSGAPDFDAMSAALAEMEASAPEEIRADVTTVKDALEAGLENDEGNPLDESEVQTANDRIFEHLAQSDCEPPDA